MSKLTISMLKNTFSKLTKRFLLNWIQVENPETKIFFIISWLAKSDSIFGEEGVRL